jgi:hypothetical protein
MDMWISSIVEGYEKVEQDYIYKDEEEWDEDGNLIYHKMWEDGEIVQDLLLSYEA